MSNYSSGQNRSSGNRALDAMRKARSEEAKKTSVKPENAHYNVKSSYKDEQPLIRQEITASGRKMPEMTEKPVKSNKIDRQSYPKKDNTAQSPHAKKQVKKPKKQNKNIAKAVKIISVAVIAVFVILCGYTFLYPNIHSGVKAGDISLGGMSIQDAEKAIDKAATKILESESMKLHIYDTDYEIKVSDVADGLDSEQSAQNAYDYTREGNVFSRIGKTAAALLGRSKVQLALNVDDKALSDAVDKIAEEAICEPTAPSWWVEDIEMVIDMGRAGVNFDVEQLKESVKHKLQIMDFSTLDVAVETTEQEKDIDALLEDALGDPQNATVDKTDGTTIIPSRDGLVFDIEQVKKEIGDGSEQTYRFTVKVEPAKVTAEELAEVLFRDTLASTSTKLDPSNKTRTNNVRLASNNINGTILNPGEEFSYNTVVGERTIESGFASAGAYANGQVVTEVGGGVCQPSSTLYMAVLRADLEVTQRQNHSLTVSYTPLGEDATVSWGGPDFCFKNDTDYPIKILASQEGSYMKVQIIGTKTTDKTVTLKTEITETLNYEIIEKVDNSLSPGERETQQSGATGYKTVTYKIITENGVTTTEKANTSYYKSRDKIVLVGPEQTSTPDTETTQTPSESGNTNGESSNTGETNAPSVDPETVTDPENSAA